MFDSLRGGGFIKGSAAALGDVFLGGRMLLVGCIGTLGGFASAITNSGIGERLGFFGLGCVCLVLARLSWRHVAREQTERQAERLAKQQAERQAKQQPRRDTR
ncbi:hypothetical protein DSC45_28430 [Streptomyces sp. YIM 130001]|uniref:hypothetical protein n=1 Tax=Streptomyces sp. YIM 130001 TaxID=2259644 RepID=UPI000E65AC38|nr:hypothetical protein [Streptomyces sp. YIM 130001]RII11844.1 hypothetical protein DSC45_28430 [Streptomyces sp. YIM 130001]